MLAKEFKLKNSEDIKATLKEGRRSRGQNLSVFFRSVPAGQFQAAVVISKKVAGTAVMRNRVRRIIFAELAKLLSALADRAAGSMVVLVSRIPEDEKLLTPELTLCLKQLLLI